MALNNESTLINLLLCGLLGLIGQGIRVIIGLKKLREEASNVASQVQATAVPAEEKAVYNQLFDPRQLWLSLFIGFIAGCLAGLVGINSSDEPLDSKAQSAIIAAGYAGTDFIEGIFKKMLPSA